MRRLLKLFIIAICLAGTFARGNDFQRVDIPLTVNSLYQTNVLWYSMTLLWTPSNIIVAAWYDAADASTIMTSGSAVTNWMDKSGNGLHLSQTNATLRPATGATINSLNAIRFDLDYMATASNNFGATISNAFVIAVHREDVRKWGYLFSLTGSALNLWEASAPWDNSAVYFDCGGSAFPNRVTTGYGIGVGAIVLVSFYCSTAENVQQVYKNGAFLVGDGSGHAVDNTSGKIMVGGRPGSLQKQSVGEFIVVNGTVDTATRQKLEGYLAWKWGLQASLPSNHPYKFYTSRE